VWLESVRERLRLGGERHAFALESAPGKGTRVRVTLPLAPRTHRLEHPAAPAASPPLPHEGCA
jgi:hypothetical protein